MEGGRARAYGEIVVSQSTGNLPAAAAAAASSGNGGAAPTTSPATTNSVPSFSRSPPKTTIHRKTTLTAIQEGVEMGHSHLHRHHHPVRHTESQPESKRSTDVPRRNSKKSRKTDDENNVTRNGHCENMGSTGTVGSDPPTEKKEKKGVLKWLTSALRKSKDKDMSDSCSCNSS
ncbi:unnamed protein product [Nippostrongylus brasiliensis]|uniref:Uncharacterized protein n=1 Tax=Nippostrongylus brasiliensis TaxID=27835 RepID=A0A0N4Y2S8_NIPBR|nr:unnamed protein product [Nippostrongylus brasiliensis]